MKQTPVNIKTNVPPSTTNWWKPHCRNCLNRNRDQIDTSRQSQSGRYHCILKRRTLVRNMYIAEYFYGTYNNHNVRRDRKLLLNKNELNKLMRWTKNPASPSFPPDYSLTKEDWQSSTSPWQEAKAVRQTSVYQRKRRQTCNGTRI